MSFDANYNPNNVFADTTWVKLSENKFLLPYTKPNQTGGENTHTLTISEMPSHYHNIGIARNAYIGSGYGIDSTSSVKMNTNSQGGGKAHNNIPAYRTVCVWQRTV